MALDMNVASEQDVNAAYNFYTSHGFSPIAASYMVGNLVWESHLDPNMHEFGGGGGFGLAQFTNDGAKNALQKWLDDHPKVDPFRAQLDFTIQWRIKVTHKFQAVDGSNEEKAKQALQGTKADGTDGLIYEFEHYGVPGRRFDYGNAIWNNVNNKRPAGNGFTGTQVHSQVQGKVVPKTPPAAAPGARATPARGQFSGKPTGSGTSAGSGSGGTQTTSNAQGRLMGHGKPNAPSERGPAGHTAAAQRLADAIKHEFDKQPVDDPNAPCQQQNQDQGSQQKPDPQQDVNGQVGQAPAHEEVVSGQVMKPEGLHAAPALAGNWPKP